jgi:hypothetical protein
LFQRTIHQVPLDSIQLQLTRAQRYTLRDAKKAKDGKKVNVLSSVEQTKLSDSARRSLDEKLKPKTIVDNDDDDNENDDNDNEDNEKADENNVLNAPQPEKQSEQQPEQQQPEQQRKINIRIEIAINDGNNVCSNSKLQFKQINNCIYKHV